MMMLAGKTSPTLSAMMGSSQSSQTSLNRHAILRLYPRRLRHTAAPHHSGSCFIHGQEPIRNDRKRLPNLVVCNTAAKHLTYLYDHSWL